LRLRVCRCQPAPTARLICPTARRNYVREQQEPLRRVEERASSPLVSQISIAVSGSCPPERDGPVTPKPAHPGLSEQTRVTGDKEQRRRQAACRLRAHRLDDPHNTGKVGNQSRRRSMAAAHCKQALAGCRGEGQGPRRPMLERRSLAASTSWAHRSSSTASYRNEPESQQQQGRDESRKRRAATTRRNSVLIGTAAVLRCFA